MPGLCAEARGVIPFPNRDRFTYDPPRETGPKVTGNFGQACEKAGLSGFLFHDLRRTAVRNVIRACVPEKIAMQISSHKRASIL